MARSLRSQGKKRFRAIKRENVFKPVEDARLARLAEAQAKAAEKPKVGDHMEEEKLENDSMMDTTDETKKISTSGARNNKVARKLAKKKAKKAHKPKSTKNLF
ncbi:hypothetical protein BDA99DRAFT_554060 [Phascolomyces articulosus]|uniref:DUF2423 domain-containing protein n=1 Tax=Phascolomyces articulosus TaxID=60185 RepID=A0AAD5KQ49_9FUNG|nr:hypothetical protein BDA99DRAFT_554060 [Phascolomyces articulosus]